ncbi:MAG: hypothetical protein ACFFEN_07725 [Candidatus Thorarchaeota archaeon]
MERLGGYVNGNFAVHVVSYGSQIFTLFNNSHDKIKENFYRFSIYCSNIDGHLPNPSFEIKLHLVDPRGKALQSLRMNLHPSDLQNPYYDSKKAVKFQIDIDLNMLCQEEGVWHYFFTLEDESHKKKVVYLPKNGYILGPQTVSLTTAVFMGHSVSSIPGEMYVLAGFLKNDLEFIVNFFYWKDLKDVYLCLIPARKTEGMGISNTVGIKKFNMELVKSDGKYFGDGDFRCTINFENLGYKDVELGWFYYYYETVLKDGTKGYQCQQKAFYSKHEDPDLSIKEIDEDFNGPFVASNHPQLVDYLFEDSEHSIYSPSFHLGEIECELPEKEPKTEYQVKSNYTLRFEVLYSDSEGNKPSEGYPRLILINKELDKKYDYTMFPNNVVSSFCQNYGEVFNSYICDVDWARIGEGIWNFYFEERNSDGKLIKSLLGKEKFLRI